MNTEQLSIPRPQNEKDRVSNLKIIHREGCFSLYLKLSLLASTVCLNHD